MTVSPRQIAFQLVALQALVAIVVAGVWFIAGWIAGVSALLGGLAATLPNLYFAARFFVAMHARQANRILKAFYWGELTKLLLSAFLVVSISRLWPNLAILPFFSDFVAVYLAIWLTPLVMRK